MGTGSFSGVKSGRSVTLTTHALLVRRSWKGRGISCYCVVLSLFVLFCCYCVVLLLFVLFCCYCVVLLLFVLYCCYCVVLLLLCCSVVICIVLLLLCCSTYCWCVNVHCTTATRCLTKCSWQIHINTSTHPLGHNRACNGDTLPLTFCFGQKHPYYDMLMAKWNFLQWKLKTSKLGERT